MDKGTTKVDVQPNPSTNSEDKTTATTTKDTEPTKEELLTQLDRERKMRKDTQASYTKSRQELAQLKAEAEARASLPTLSTEEQEHLDNLKVTDPDAWYQEKLKIDTKATQHINLSVQEATNKLALEAELLQRESVLTSFNANRQTLGLPPLDENAIAFDNIPPRITKKLEQGDIDYNTYLTEVSAFVDAPKVITKTDEVVGDPTLGNANGSNTPTKPNDNNKDIVIL